MDSKALVDLLQRERLIEVCEGIADKRTGALRGWDLRGWHVMGRDGVVLLVRKKEDNSIIEGVLCVHADERRRPNFDRGSKEGYPVTLLMRGQFKE